MLYYLLLNPATQNPKRKKGVFYVHKALLHLPGPVRFYRYGIHRPVSYTHLDVYKRQGNDNSGLPRLPRPFILLRKGARGRLTGGGQHIAFN